MASIRRRESGGKTRWQVRWRQGGQSKAETFDTEKKAVTFRGLVDANDQRYPEGWVPGVGFLKVAEGGGQRQDAGVLVRRLHGGPPQSQRSNSAGVRP